MNDDLELLRQYAASGSESAFAAMVDRYKGLVYASALRQTGSADLAEEITQAVFILLARKGPSLPGNTILSGWLFRTTCFVSRDALKLQHRRQRREYEAILMNSDPPSRPNEEEAVWHEIAPALDESLSRLGELDRHALLLRFFERKKLADVGQVLGLTEDGARKRVDRALEKLRHLLGKRGITVPTALFITLLTAHAAPAAPATLAISATAATTTASLATLTLMTWSKTKIALVTCAALFFTGSATVVTILLVRGPHAVQDQAAVTPPAPAVTNAFSENELVTTDFTEPPADAEGFISLFNGRDLTGWNYNPLVWSVSNGAIVARAPIDSRSTVHVMAWAGGEVDDFELRLRVRTTGNCNSGVPLRARWAQQRWFPGYQAEIHGQNTGLLIIAGPGRERKLCRAGWRTLAGDENGQNTLESIERISDEDKIFTAREAVRSGEWSDFRIVAQGPRILIQLNGVSIVDTRDEHPAKYVPAGEMGFEYMHARGTSDTVEFKDIRFRRGLTKLDSKEKK